MRVSGQFYFLNKKISHTKSTESTKTHISEQKQKSQRFYALKKHLSGRKLLVHLYVFLCFLCAFCAFLCVKQKRQHFYAHKKHLRERKSCVWRFLLLVLFVLFMLFMRIKKSKRKQVACLRSVLFCAFYASCAFWAWKIFSFKK